MICNIIELIHSGIIPKNEVLLIPRRGSAIHPIPTCRWGWQAAMELWGSSSQGCWGGTSPCAPPLCDRACAHHWTGLTSKLHAPRDTVCNCTEQFQKNQPCYTARVSESYTPELNQWAWRTKRCLLDCFGSPIHLCKCRLRTPEEAACSYHTWADGSKLGLKSSTVQCKLQKEPMVHPLWGS